MDDRHLRLVERLFDAFNRRDADEIADLCDDRMEFYAVTGDEIGRGEPYVGWEGLRAYLEDVGRVWEELLISPDEVEEHEGLLLVRGRVFLRSRTFGIRDMPGAWLWKIEGERFTRGEVFIDPEEAVSRFRTAVRKGQPPDPNEPRSMPRLR
jgi:ketosteroid isomerase-like protein